MNSCFTIPDSQHAARPHQIVVEDLAGHVQQLADQGVSQRILHEQALFARADDALIAEDDELLGDDRLLKPQRLLELLNGAPSTDENLEDLDP